MPPDRQTKACVNLRSDNMPAQLQNFEPVAWSTLPVCLQKIILYMYKHPIEYHATSAHHCTAVRPYMARNVYDTRVIFWSNTAHFQPYMEHVPYSFEFSFSIFTKTCHLTKMCMKMKIATCTFYLKGVRCAQYRLF